MEERLSLALIEEEVRRFLSSQEPEVLCIKGKWGVGKTYGWMKYLDQAKAGSALALDQYSYVSLFGLSSLEDLRYTIFERSVSGDDIGKEADENTFKKLIDKKTETSRRFRSVIEGVEVIFKLKGMADVLTRSAALAVRKQLICLDDLERAGEGLNVRDVLGLVSFLKLERQCKLVLLLNDEEHSEKEEFDKQLEKVADVTVVFDPTVEEAAEIAFCEDDEVTSLLRPRVIELGITNIRVIKKIEALARRLYEILNGVDKGVLEQAMATLALASWGVYQPNDAPSIEFLQKYNQLADVMRDAKKEEDPVTSRWRKILTGYSFRHADQFDMLIMDGARRGYFLRESLCEQAKERETQYEHNSRDSDFSRAWQELYHGSLSVADDDFLNELYRAAIKEAEFISALSINSAICLLRENERGQQADEVMEKWFSDHDREPLEFYHIYKHHFSKEDRIDDGFKAAFELRRNSYQDDRNPFEVLKEIGRGESWGEGEVALMAKQSPDDFEKMFEALRGREMGEAIETILRMGRDRYEGSPAIQDASVEALRRIARKSPLRARKVARFGVTLDTASEADERADST